MPSMAGFAVGLLMAGFIGACLAEPWCRMVRAISGDGLLTDPALVRIIGYVTLAAGAILFSVDLVSR